MTQEPDSAPPDLLAELDAAACTRLLAAVRFGRLAVVEGGVPRIVVLNFMLDGADVLFRTKPDTLAARLTRGDASVPAEFEVDDALSVQRAGWSVIVKGLLGREDDDRVIASARSRITAWAQGERDVVLRLRAERLTGWQVGRP